MSNPIYIKVVSLSNGTLVGVLCTNKDGENVEFGIRKMFGDVITGKHLTIGSISRPKLFGVSHFPGQLARDYITPAGLTPDPDYRYYTLNGSLFSNMILGAMITFTLRGGLGEFQLDTESLMRAWQSGDSCSPLSVTTFDYHHEPVQFVDRPNGKPVEVIPA
jgi:hypothetical protein